MASISLRSVLVPAMATLLSGCMAATQQLPETQPAMALAIDMSSPGQAAISYDLASPVKALHFPQELGGYRLERWQPVDHGFRWIEEGEGERLERSDGRRFKQVTFTLPVDYRFLPKSYAPFSPFSDGSTLIHSGQFHTCFSAPCDRTEPITISVEAPGKIIGVAGRRTPNHDTFQSDEEGTNIFIGTLAPVEADGFIAIVDPGLPTSLRQHLDRSLPMSMTFFAKIYGPLSFKPELYVSMDDTPETTGRISTQGGTLPNQIFIHFDGENAKQRLTSGTPYWLDWFFAHEAAHLFQQDQVGSLPGDDDAGWLHEGGADAMAALAMAGRGEAEQAYVSDREAKAEEACSKGLARYPLNKATAEGNFDLHYQCGLVIWLALDQELRAVGHGGLNDLNRAFFTAARTGSPWNEAVFLGIARDLGATDSTISRVQRLSSGGPDTVADDVAELGLLAQQALKK